VREVLTVAGALAARTTYGSTGRRPVTEQLTSAAEQVQQGRAWSDEVVVPR
jgi:argininosuccinate lyase